VRYGLTIPQVIAAMNNAKVNVGGQTANFGAQAAVIRGLGLIDSMHDIANEHPAARRHIGEFLRQNLIPPPRHRPIQHDGGVHASPCRAP
jgi:hypothetical protein